MKKSLFVAAGIAFLTAFSSVCSANTEGREEITMEGILDMVEGFYEDLYSEKDEQVHVIEVLNFIDKTINSFN